MTIEVMIAVSSSAAHCRWRRKVRMWSALDDRPLGVTTNLAGSRRIVAISEAAKIGDAKIDITMPLTPEEPSAS